MKRIVGVISKKSSLAPPGTYMNEQAVFIESGRDNQNTREKTAAVGGRSLRSLQKTDKTGPNTSGSAVIFSLSQSRQLLKGARRLVSASSGDMFKKSKSKVLVDYASEEDDMSWHYHHSYKDKDIEGEEEEEEEEAVSPISKEAKVKKIMSKKERREKKMFSSKDDEHFLLTGVKLADRRGSHKKIKDDEKEKDKKDKPEKSHCFWESVTMTMRQISPTKKLEKMEGWEPPQLGDITETLTDEAPEAKSQTRDSPVSFPHSLGLPLGLGSWAGRGLEEDSSRYANLSDSRDSTPVRWTALAKGKLAGISRRSRGIVSESSWEGFK